MSVTNQTDKIYGDGNGVTVTFSYPFKIFDSSQLVVYLINKTTQVATGPLILNTDYTVVINPVTDGGTVTFMVAPAVGFSWFVKRVVPYTQSAVIPSEGVFPGPQFENQLDLMTMMIIQGQEAVNRAIQMPLTFIGTTPIMPTPADGLVIGWLGTDGTLTNYAASGMGPLAVPIADSNLQQIVTALKVSGTALTGLALIPSGAGVIPIANIPTIPLASKVSGLLPVANITPFPYVKCSNVQASGTGGGSTTSGSWGTVILNTKDSDTGSIASLCTANANPVVTCTAANQIVLPAGTYKVVASSPFAQGSGNIAAQLRLANQTASTVLLTGQGAATSAASGSQETIASLRGIFTLSVISAIALQYKVNTSQATTGLGQPVNFDSEVYAVIELEKIA